MAWPLSADGTEIVVTMEETKPLRGWIDVDGQS